MIARILRPMILLALALDLSFLLVGFGVRTAVQLRATADSGWRIGRPHSVAELGARSGFVAALVLLVALLVAGFAGATADLPTWVNGLGWRSASVPRTVFLRSADGRVVEDRRRPGGAHRARHRRLYRRCATHLHGDGGVSPGQVLVGVAWRSQPSSCSSSASRSR